MFVCRNVPPGHHGLLLSGSSPRPLHLILHGCRTSDWLRHPIARARVRTHPLRFDHGYGELLRARVVVFRLDAQSPASCSINFSKSEHVFICTRAHMILSAALSRGLCLSFITLASVLTPPLPGVALDAALANDRCTISQCPLIFRMRVSSFRCDVAWLLLPVPKVRPQISLFALIGSTPGGLSSLRNRMGSR